MIEKAITIKEAKRSDIGARILEDEVNSHIRALNHQIELLYPSLSYDRWLYHSPPLPGFERVSNVLKEMYNKNGFDFEWRPPYTCFKMKLLKR